MTLLELDPDQLLSTTRAVRKRLDFDRPVPLELLRECVTMALQAPSGSNIVTMRFVIVTDEDKRAAIGELYRSGYEDYRNSERFAGSRPVAPDKQAQQDRVVDSADYLSSRFGEAPAIVVACNLGADRPSAVAGMANILPAAWSFMLAARARGLGTVWTSMHVARERELAQLLGIPYERVAVGVVTPVAFTKGTDFKPAKRPAADDVIHWDGWRPLAHPLRASTTSA